MRTRLVAAIAVASALMVPSGAAAGGFATVGLDPLPDGIGPGKQWRVQLTILQHGRTPLDGLAPEVIVTRGSVRQAFVARPAGRPGVYRARVVFPSAGTWHYAVDDGFSMTHTFPAVRVRAPGSDKTPVAAAGAARSSDSSGDGPDTTLALVIAAVAGLVAALGSAMLRWRPAGPAPESG